MKIFSDQDERHAVFIWFFAVGAIFLLAGLIHVGKSYFEARTYSRLTGKQVTTWDAIWVELRIQESAEVASNGGAND